VTSVGCVALGIFFWVLRPRWGRQRAACRQLRRAANAAPCCSACCGRLAAAQLAGRWGRHPSSAAHPPTPLHCCTAPAVLPSHSQLCGCSMRPGHPLNSFLINLHYSLVEPDPCIDLCVHMIPTSSTCHVPTQAPCQGLRLPQSPQSSVPIKQAGLVSCSSRCVGGCQRSSGVLCISRAANHSHCVGLSSLAPSASLVMWGRLIVAP
jgi:hypothetical protein